MAYYRWMDEGGAPCLEISISTAVAFLAPLP